MNTDLTFSTEIDSFSFMSLVLKIFLDRTHITMHKLIQMLPEKIESRRVFWILSFNLHLNVKYMCVYDIIQCNTI